MALTQTWHCDKCGDRIQPGDRFSYKPVTGPVRYGPTLDVCGGCHQELRSWLAPTPEPAAVPARPRPRKPAAVASPRA